MTALDTGTEDLRAEIDGQIQTQEVRVRSGEVSEAQFTFPAAGIASR